MSKARFLSPLNPIIQKKTILNIKIKRLSADAVLPSYAHPGDAGMDLYACGETVLEPGAIQLIKTGLAIELPAQTEAQIRPKSGLALKHGISVLNTPGTIDEGYRGEIGVILINHGSGPFSITKGMKVAQMVIKPVLSVDVIEVEELNDSSRGTGGFGSTGHSWKR